MRWSCLPDTALKSLNSALRPYEALEGLGALRPYKALERALRLEEGLKRPYELNLKK
jgi:hypothetical protein